MKALVVFSGGQDSTTCLAQACTDFPNEVMAVSFFYGQRHTIELNQARKIAELANVSLLEFDLSFIASLSPNALTQHDIPIMSLPDGLPNTFVPGRNLFFLSVAGVLARQFGVSYIYTGVCETDFSGYPDCRDEFIRSCQATLNLALESKIEIRTPLMFLDKAETVLLMKQLGYLSWLALSHTCYEGKRPACGRCPACLLRLKGFEKAGIQDPLAYE